MFNTPDGGGYSTPKKKKKKSGRMLGGIADAASSAATSAANSVNRASGGSGLSSYRTPSYARTPQRRPQGQSGPTLADVLSGIRADNIKNRPDFGTDLSAILTGAKESVDTAPKPSAGKNEYVKNQINDLGSLVGLDPKTGKPLPNDPDSSPLTPYSRKLKRQQERRESRLDRINPQYPEGFDPKHPNWMPLGSRIAVPENVKKQWSTKTWWQQSEVDRIKALYADDPFNLEIELNNIFEARQKDEQDWLYRRNEAKVDRIKNVLYKAGSESGRGNYDYLEEYMAKHPKFSLEAPSYRTDFGMTTRYLRNQMEKELSDPNLSDAEKASIAAYYSDPKVGLINHYEQIRSGQYGMSYTKSRQEVADAVRSFKEKYQLNRETALDSSNDDYVKQAEDAPETPVIPKAGQGTRKITQLEKMTASLFGMTPEEYVKRIDDKAAKDQQDLTDAVGEHYKTPDPMTLYSLVALASPNGKATDDFFRKKNGKLADIDDDIFMGRVRETRKDAKETLGVKALPSTETMLELKALYGELDLKNKDEVDKFIAKFQNPMDPDTRVMYMRYAMQQNPKLDQKAALDWVNGPIETYINDVLVPQAEYDQKKAIEDAEAEARYDATHWNGPSDVVSDQLKAFGNRGIPIIDAGISPGGGAHVNVSSDSQDPNFLFVQKTDLFWTIDKIIRPLQFMTGAADAFFGLDQDKNHSWTDQALGFFMGANPLNSVDEIAKDPSLMGDVLQGGSDNFQRSILKDEHPLFTRDVLANNAKRSDYYTLADETWYQHTAGFLGDVLFDPTTYIGVGMIRSGIRGGMKLTELAGLTGRTSLDDIANAERVGMSYLNPDGTFNDAEVAHIVDPDALLPESELAQAVGAFKLNVQKGRHWVIPRQDLPQYEGFLGRPLSEDEFRFKNTLDEPTSAASRGSDNVVYANDSDLMPKQPLAIEVGPVGRAEMAARGADEAVSPAGAAPESPRPRFESKDRAIPGAGFTTQQQMLKSGMLLQAGEPGKPNVAEVIGSITDNDIRHQQRELAKAEALLRNDLSNDVLIESMERLGAKAAENGDAYVPANPLFDLRVERLLGTSDNGREYYKVTQALSRLLQDSDPKYTVGIANTPEAKAAERQYSDFLANRNITDDDPYSLLPSSLGEIDDLGRFLGPDVSRKVSYYKPIDPKVGELEDIGRVHNPADEDSILKSEELAPSLPKQVRKKDYPESTADLEQLVQAFRAGSFRGHSAETLKRALADGIAQDTANQLRKMIAKAVWGKNWQKGQSLMPKSWDDETILSAFLIGPRYARKASAAVALREKFANEAFRTADGIIKRPNSLTDWQLRQQAVRLRGEAETVLNTHRLTGALMYLEDVHVLERTGRLVSNPTAYSNMERLRERIGQELSESALKGERFYDDSVRYPDRPSLTADEAPYRMSGERSREGLDPEDFEGYQYVDHAAEDKFEADLKKLAEAKKRGARGPMAESYAGMVEYPKEATAPATQRAFDFDDPDFDLADYDFATLTDPMNTGAGYASREQHLQAIDRALEKRMRALNLVNDEGQVKGVVPIESRVPNNRTPFNDGPVGRFADENGNLVVDELRKRIKVVATKDSKIDATATKKYTYSKTDLSAEEAQFLRNVTESMNDRARQIVAEKGMAAKPEKSDAAPVTAKSTDEEIAAHFNISAPTGKLTPTDTRFGFGEKFPEGFDTQDEFVSALLRHGDDEVIDTRNFTDMLFSYKSPANAMFNRTGQQNGKGFFDGHGWDNVGTLPDEVTGPAIMLGDDVYKSSKSFPGAARADLFKQAKASGMSPKDASAAVDKAMADWSEEIVSFIMRNYDEGKISKMTLDNSFKRVWNNSMGRSTTAYRAKIAQHRENLKAGVTSSRQFAERDAKFGFGRDFDKRYDEALKQAGRETVESLKNGTFKGSEAAFRADNLGYGNKARVRRENPIENGKPLSGAADSEQPMLPFTRDMGFSGNKLPNTSAGSYRGAGVGDKTHVPQDGKPFFAGAPRMTVTETHRAQVRAIRQDVKVQAGTARLKAADAMARGDKQAAKQFMDEVKVLTAGSQRALVAAESARKEAILLGRAIKDEYRVAKILDNATMPVKVPRFNLYTALVGRRAGVQSKAAFLDEAEVIAQSLPQRMSTWFGEKFIRPTKQLQSHEARVMWAQYQNNLPFVIKVHLEDLNAKMGQLTPETRIGMMDAMRNNTTYMGVGADAFDTVKQAVDEVLDIWNYKNEFYSFPSLVHDGSHTPVDWDEISRFLPKGTIPDQKSLTAAMQTKGRIDIDDFMKAVKSHAHGNPGLINDPYTFVYRMRVAADQARAVRRLQWGIDDTFGHMRKFTVDKKYNMAFQKSPIEALKDEGYRTVPALDNRAYFHPDIVNDVAKLTEMLVSEDTRMKVTKLLDEGLGFWKQATTLPNPGYYTRNGIGEMMVAWLDGLWDPKWYYKASRALKYMNGSDRDLKALVEQWSVLKDQIPVNDVKGNSLLFKAKASGDNVSIEQGIKMFYDRGLSSTFVNTDLARSLRSVTANAYREQGVRRAFGKANEGLHAFGENFEDMFRMGHFFFALEQEAKKIGNLEKAADNAAKRVVRSHFDYGDLSTFEKVVMKRIFPFYTWTRKAFPLMVAHLFITPGKMTMYPKAMDATSNVLSSRDVQDDDNGFLPNYDGIAPQWVVDLMAYQMGGVEDPTDKYANYFRMATPQMDALGMMNNPWDQAGLPLLNPLIKLGAENPVFGMNQSLDGDFNYPIAGGELNEMNGVSGTESTAIWAARTLNPVLGFLAKTYQQEGTEYGEYTEENGRKTSWDTLSFATGGGFYQGMPKFKDKDSEDRGASPAVGPFDLSDVNMEGGRAALKAVQDVIASGAQDGNDPELKKALELLSGVADNSSGGKGKGRGWRNFGGSGWRNFGGSGSGSGGFDLWALLKQLEKMVDQPTEDYEDQI